MRERVTATNAKKRKPTRKAGSGTIHEMRSGLQLRMALYERTKDRATIERSAETGSAMNLEQAVSRQPETAEPVPVPSTPLVRSRTAVCGTERTVVQEPGRVISPAA